MTNTRDKLNEAKYFLEEMKRVSSEPDKFRYELTAFLNASRSITHIMQKEFSSKTGFNDWYTKKQLEMQNNGTLRYLHAQRRISFHMRPVLSYPIKVTSQSFDATGRMRVIITGTSTSINLTPAFVPLEIKQPPINIGYYFDDIPNEERDVITICQEALNALEIIVTECENKFC